MAAYDIGASAAQATSTSQNQAAPTVFNFSSPGGHGGFYDQEATAEAKASAVGKGSLMEGLGSIPTPVLVAAGLVALLGVGALVYIAVKK